MYIMAFSPSSDSIAELNSRGEITHDLLVNLFKGYAVSMDKMFRQYIQNKENDYDEGIKITSDKLMMLAANKYKVIVDKGVWNAPSEEEEKIVALEAKIKKMTAKANLLPTRGKARTTTQASRTRKRRNPSGCPSPPKRETNIRKW